MHNLHIYFRKKNLIDHQELSHTVKVVVTFCDHLKNNGHNLYTDRFYSSPILAENLTKIGISCTGTVMSNKKALPKDVKNKTKMAKGDCISYKCNNMTVTEWMDKRKIVMLSTKYVDNK